MNSKVTNMPSPTEEDLKNPVFQAIWNVVKTWDVNVAGRYTGYCGASGSHVKMILDGIKEMEEDKIKHFEVIANEAHCDGDLEQPHVDADKFLLQMLDEFGFGKIVEMFKKMPKWYA